MGIPTTVEGTLFFAAVAMVCWGLWINTAKLAAPWRFELFSLDFAIGVLFCAAVAAITLGTYGADITILDNLQIVRRLQVGYGLLLGLSAALAIMLTLAAVTVEGIMIGFTVAAGFGFGLGQFWHMAGRPDVDYRALYGGLALVLVAVALLCWAHSVVLAALPPPPVAAGKKKAPPPPPSPLKGIFLSAGAGLVFSPFLAVANRATRGAIEMGPYSLGIVMAGAYFFGTLLSSIYFINLPVQGMPISFSQYFKGSVRNHLLGLVAGIVWMVGGIAIFFVMSAPPDLRSIPQTRYLIAPGSIALAFVSGGFWRELTTMPGKAKGLAAMGLLLTLGGLAMMFNP